MANEQQGSLEINTPALPKGGGAIQSIGKGWGGVGTTGAASLALPLPISKPPNRDLAPALDLDYSSDVGNSPFGIGWRLTTNAITLRTTKGVPKYEGNDQVVGPGGDVWMPERRDNGELISELVSKYNNVELGEHHVVRYWPRVEGAFDRIEHWTKVKDADNPAGFWLIHGADGSLHCYGKTEASRRADPNDKSHVGVWLIDESLNLRGEHVVYLYQAEVQAPVAPQFRDYRAQRYLRRVLYGNAQANANLYAWKADGWKDVTWHFHLVFDYGERSADLTQVPMYDLSGIESGKWGEPRKDPFWNYAYGFELGSRRLCRQVLMFHQFTEELGDDPVLVQRLLLEHRPSALGYNHLTAAHIQAYDSQGQMESRPPMEFFYNPFELDPQRQGYSEFPQMPGLNDGQRYQLVDLYGEGIPGVLFSSDKAWYYREPLRADSGGNDVSYGDWALLPGIPVADSSKPIRQSLSDLTGDGKLDWVIARPGMSGFFTLNPDRSWSNFVAFDAFPSEFFHPDAQLADLVGDGLTDLALIGPRSVRLYSSRRAVGFSQGANFLRCKNDDSLPLLSSAQTELVAFSDPLGSAAQHLIRIRHNEVKCWPNLGHGKFGKGFVLCELKFTYAEFDSSRVRLADLDGSGAVDLIYLESDGFRVYMNHAGEGFEENYVKMPWPQGVRYDRFCQVSIADLNGLGCSSLILTVPHMKPQHWRYDFVNAKPYLVNSSHNNMGAVTGVSYRSSAQEWLDEKAELIAAGKAPVSHLPFAMHLVSQQTQLDEITGNRLTQGFTYRQGFYDSFEREFRGFALLRQTDTEASAAERSSPGFTAPILSKTWFHTGRAIDMRDDGYYAGDTEAVPLQATLLHEYHLSDAAGRVIAPDEDLAREMARTLSGSVLRTEVFAADDDPETAVPYSVQENRFLIRHLRPKGEHHPYAVLQLLALESITYQYEPQVPDDPLVQHTLNLQWDKFGGLTHGFVVHYARRKTDKDSPPFAVNVPGDESDEDYENRWWLDAHDEAQQCWYLTEAKAEYCHLDKGEGWRLGIPYRQRSNALVLKKNELEPCNIYQEKFLELAHEDGAWAAQAVLTGLSLQRYLDPAKGELLDPDKLIFTALPHYQETAELDATALSAFDKLKDENGNMPFNLKEKLESVGYHIMKLFLPTVSDSDPEDRTDAKNYLWSVRKSFPVYHDLPGFYNVKSFQQTECHGSTSVAYDKHWCLSTAVTLPDGCTTRILGVDYRSFLPAGILDPNQNTQEARYNAFGEVLVTSFYGTELGVEVGFYPLSDYQPPEDRTPAGAIADKEKAIDNYATATFSAPFSWMGKVPSTTSAPWLRWARAEGFVLPDGHLCSRARVHLEGLQNPTADEQRLQQYVDNAHREPVHVLTLQADRYPGDPELQIRAAIACWDGFGRSLQTKQEVEPGLAWWVDENGELTLDKYGRPKEAEVARRWRVSERVEYNNKGETVRIYRPYFANTYRYINDEAIREAGYHDQQFYDAAGRPTHTVLAKKMLQGNPPELKPLRREKRYRIWSTLDFDENDNFDPPKTVEETRRDNRTLH